MLHILANFFKSNLISFDFERRCSVCRSSSHAALNGTCVLLLRFKREIKVRSGMAITLKCVRGVSTIS